MEADGATRGPSGTNCTTPRFLVWLMSVVTFTYVVVAFGFQGVPGVSRIAMYAAALLFLFVLLRSFSGVRIPFWIALILLFYSYLIFPALVIEGTSFDKLGSMVVVLVGTMSIGIALNNQFVAYKVVAYGAVVAGVLNVIAVQLGIDTTPITGGRRVSGLMGNPNSLAICMAYAAFLVWLFPQKFNLLIRILAVALAGYGLMVSGSRKGLILISALVVIVAVDQLFKFGKIKMAVIFPFVVAGLLVFGGAMYSTVKHYGDDMVSVQRLQKGFSGQDQSYNDRTRLIESGLQLWKESPLIGHGFSQFSRISGFGAYAHNNYVEIAVSGGIIGLLLFYSMHALIFFKSLKSENLARIKLIILLLTITVVDMALVSFYNKSAMCMIVVLLATFPVQNEEL